MSNLHSVLRPRLEISWLGWVAAVVLLIGSIIAAHQSRDAAKALADAVLKREHVESKRARLARTVTRLSLEDTRQWQMVSAEINFPWNDFFQAAERTSNVEIELLEMAPEKSRRSMLLRGEARNSAALVKYIKALAVQPTLLNVFVSRMQNIERGGLLTIEFEIRVSIL